MLRPFYPSSFEVQGCWPLSIAAYLHPETYWIKFM